MVSNSCKERSRLHGRIFSSFDAGSAKPDLPGLCHSLFFQQKNQWPALSQGIDALNHVRVRDLPCNGFSVKLQFNPARIISSAAPVDPQAISKRPCFLCAENLPDPQKGVLYRQEFLILCNPFPIFNQHYTVSHITHIPQSFAGSVTLLLDLAKDLSPDFNVFYNGPRAGASAPDHLHFQAAPAGVLPIEKELREAHNHRPLTFMDGISFFTIGNLGREILVIEGKAIDVVSAALLTIMDRLKAAIPTSDEPMMNLFCSYRENIWRIVIFLRRKHRPDAYYLTCKKRILISPGLVDMAGLIITPVEKDFTTLDAATLENIYLEISLDTKIIQRVMDF
jgi:hypothetical protein